MAKKARPAETPRSVRFYVILSEEERARLDELARDNGMSRADIMRQSLRNFPTPSTRRDA